MFIPIHVEVQMIIKLYISNTHDINKYVGHKYTGQNNPKTKDKYQHR